MKGRTAKHYANNPESYAKKMAYDKRYNAKEENIAKRAELVKINRKRGKVGDGLDASHTKNGIVLKKASVNRGSKNDAPGDRRARGGKK